MTFRKLCQWWIGGFFIAVLFHVVRVWLFGAAHYPEGTFLFSPADRFSDLTNLLPPLRSGNPYSWNGSVYFPFSYGVLWPFSWLRNLQAVVLFLIVSIVGLVWVWRSAGASKWILMGCVFFSYPVWFALDRANPEIFVFLFLAVFLIRRFDQKKGDWVFLALATAMKGYPGVFAILLLKQKRLKDFGFFVLTTVLLSVGSLMTFSEGFSRSLIQLKENLHFHHEMYIFGDLSSRFNLGIWGWLKHFFWSGETQLTGELKVYFGVGVLIFLFAAWAILRQKPEKLLGTGAAPEKDILLLALVMLILPELSYDYKLLHLYLPVLIWLKRVGVRIEDCRVPTWLAALGWILIPIQYFIIESEVGIGSLLRPPILVLLFIFSCRSFFERDSYCRES